MKTELNFGLRREAKRHAALEALKLSKKAVSPLRSATAVQNLAALLLVIVISVSLADLARAQTNDLTALLQQGLFEEQANRNLAAAVSNYQFLATQFDKDRQIAATAIFRLGECYRMEGKTNEAAAEYQRILREFPDQTTLATLSRQDLAGMGMAMTSSEDFQEKLQRLLSESGAATNTLPRLNSPTLSPSAQIQALELERLNALNAGTAKASNAAIWDKVKNLSQTDLENVLPTLVSDSALTSLLQQRNNAETKLAELQVDYGPNNPEVLKQKAILDEVKKQLSERVGGIMRALKMNAEVSRAPVATGTPADEEEQEIQRIQTMIRNSPDLINAPLGNKEIGTPLIRAAYFGWLKAAAYLLDHGADINTPCSQVVWTGELQQAGNVTPLMAAVAAGNKAMTQFLIERGADVNFKGKFNGSTSLHIAAQKGFSAVTEVLVANKADVNELNNLKETPLHLAAANSNREIVSLLLAHKADVNARDAAGATPLFLAAREHQSSIVQTLLAAGADPNIENNAGITPLTLAANGGSMEIIKMLLGAKADPNAGKLDAPLLVAIHKQDAVSAELLLQAGANPDKEGNVDWDVYKDGSTYWAAGHPSETPLFLAISTEQIPMVQLLLKYKADPNDSKTDGTPVLFNALGDTNILEALLDAGGNPNSRTPTGWPLLNNAVGGTNFTVVQMLLKHGANANIRNENPNNQFGGYTPLHCAAMNLAGTNIFDLLFEYHANPNVRADNGQTPLDLLKEKMPPPVQPGMQMLIVSQEQRILAAQLADLLRQHGALDNLPDWNSIKVSRPSANFSGTVFRKGTNDWNHFTLLEFICNVFPYYGNNIPFPDFAHLTIIRPNTNGTVRRIEVNLLDATNNVDCSKDLPLQFGDTVEIPEREHTLADNDNWTSDQIHKILQFLRDRAGEAKLIVAGGKTAQLPLKDFEPTDCYIGYVLKSPAALNILTSYSDLSRAKITRRDAKTGRKNEWILDCSHSAFLLRDGDVIEVPEKR